MGHRHLLALLWSCRHRWRMELESRMDPFKQVGLCVLANVRFPPRLWRNGVLGHSGVYGSCLLHNWVQFRCANCHQTRKSERRIEAYCWPELIAGFMSHSDELFMEEALREAQ